MKFSLTPGFRERKGSLAVTHIIIYLPLLNCDSPANLGININLPLSLTQGKEPAKLIPPLLKPNNASFFFYLGSSSSVSPGIERNTLETGGAQRGSGLFHVCGHHWKVTVHPKIKATFQLNIPLSFWITFL